MRERAGSIPCQTAPPYLLHVAAITISVRYEGCDSASCDGNAVEVARQCVERHALRDAELVVAYDVARTASMLAGHDHETSGPPIGGAHVAHDGGDSVVVPWLDYSSAAAEIGVSAQRRQHVAEHESHHMLIAQRGDHRRDGAADAAGEVHDAVLRRLAWRMLEEFRVESGVYAESVAVPVDPHRDGLGNDLEEAARVVTREAAATRAGNNGDLVEALEHLKGLLMRLAYVAAADAQTDGALAPDRTHPLWTSLVGDRYDRLIGALRGVPSSLTKCDAAALAPTVKALSVLVTDWLAAFGLALGTMEESKLGVTLLGARSV